MLFLGRDQQFQQQQQSALNQEQQMIMQQQADNANRLGVIELEKQERNNMIKSLDPDVRRLLRSIHKISSIANVGKDDLQRLKQLKRERQIHVLKRTKSMLLGEYENERAEVVLRKALPSRRVMNQSKRVEKGEKLQHKNNTSMGSHHSTVVPGYSYSPRTNNNVSPQWAY